MIHITATENLPQIASMSEVMQKLADLLMRHIQEVADTSGYGWWANRLFPSGRATLGYIKRNLRKTSGENFAEVSWNSNPYDSRVAFVHEFGASIPRSDKMRKFFKYKYWKTKEPFWLAMAITKSPIIAIPKRPVIRSISATRMEEYVRFIGKEIIITSTQKKER
jgi:hypothetical protein